MVLLTAASQTNMEVVFKWFLSSIVGHIQPEIRWDRTLGLFLDLRLKYPALALQKAPPVENHFDTKTRKLKLIDLIGIARSGVADSSSQTNMEVVIWWFLSTIVGHIQPEKIMDRNLDLFLDLRLKYPSLALQKAPPQLKTNSKQKHRS